MELDFAKGDGLIVAIAQDWRSGEILMQAFINREAWDATLASGFATYYSRSRKSLWRKGESSGQRQKIHAILVDCDGDSVIYKVEQIGECACHTGHRSCFFRQLSADGECREIAPVLRSPDELYGGKKDAKA